MPLVYTKQVKPLGFKGSGMFCDSKWHLNYYRTFPKERTVVGICGGVVPEGVWRFELTAAQMKAFKNGQLSLIPPGCCSVSHRPHLEYPLWYHEGEIKNLLHLKQILASTGLFPELVKGKKAKTKKVPEPQVNHSIHFPSWNNDGSSPW